MTATDVTSCFIRRLRVADHGPMLRNGEHEFARVLETCGMSYRYECFLYPLAFSSDGQITLGFTPDFWLPESARWPELHIELTWADRNLGHIQQRERVRALACLKLKQEKIEGLRRLYGLRTLLVTASEWTEIIEHHEHLGKLLDEMLADDGA